MSYEIKVLESGFVSHDTLKPIGYAGECNSRTLAVSHPHFKDCYYQILVKRYDGLYKVGIEDGYAVIPPSLMKTATKLECQFVACSTPCSISNSETDNFIFLSDAFTLRVDEGLNTSGLSPIPTYEELQQMYCNLNKAKAEVEKAKQSNVQIYQSIQAALQNVYNTPVVDLEEQFRAEYKKQLDEISAEHLQDLFTSIVDEITRRITNGDVVPGGISEVGTMTTEQLAAFIADIHNQLMSEVKAGNASWLTSSNAYTMSLKGDVVGGR